MKIRALVFAVLLPFIISCKKTRTTNTQDKYLTTSAGSTWNYRETDSSGSAPVNTDYTLTSTSGDTSINGKNYHIFSNSTGNSRYMNVTGSDYFQFDSLPAGLGATAFERLYLKDIAPVGSNWAQTITVTLSGLPVPVTLTNRIAEKGISRSVNGTTYTDVIHVVASISSSLIPAASLTTDINSYYARKYGLIETHIILHLNFLGFVEDINTETKLVSANLL